MTKEMMDEVLEEVEELVHKLHKLTQFIDQLDVNDSAVLLMRMRNMGNEICNRIGVK